MKRRPLSMKRLTMLTGHYIIALGKEKGEPIYPQMQDFLKYVWEHKDDTLSWFPPSKTPKI
jgi:hypothetical protein